MKPSFLLACFALLPLGCGRELPAPAAAPAQRPAGVTVVDPSPPPKAPPAAAAPAPPAAPKSP